MKWNSNEILPMDKGLPSMDWNMNFEVSQI